MQPCAFSETQYSFCFTFEYINQFFPIVPLPIFPNTVAEGQEGGGYDVRINGNVYFQFKIPVYHDMYSNFFKKHWNVFDHEYYKIKLDTDGKQFRLLKNLQDPINKVYYATPEFHTEDFLRSHYRTYNIVQNSALFPIENLPDHGSGKHHLIYSPAHDWGQSFSQPKKVEKIKTIHPLELFPESKDDLTMYDQARRIRNQLVELDYPGKDDSFYNDNKPSQFVKEIHTILLTQFNIHWYPVVSPIQNGHRFL